MSAGTHNFSIEQGTSFGLTFTYANASGVPINLSSYSCARMQWNTDTNSVYTFTTNNVNSGLYYFAFSNPSSGIITLKIPASITAGYYFSTADYDMELQSSGDFYPGGGPEVIRLLEGTITIVPEITKISCSGV